MNNNADKDLVSIIIPVYNVEKYLRRCLNSVLNQTYKNIEVIIIDDGSTDCCYSICEEYKENHNNVVLIHKENGGSSSARNEGLLHIHGEYVMFVDSDDFIQKDCVRTLLSLTEKYNVPISQCEFERGSGSCFSENNKNEKIIKISDYRMYETKYINSTVWGKLYKRTAINGLRFPENRIYEDEYYTYKALYNAKEIVRTSKKLYYYYKNPNSIMKQKGKTVKLDIIDAFKERIDFFENRHEEKLKTVSVKEYCIRLIVLYARCMAANNSKSDLQYIKNLFDMNYKTIKKEKILSFKEKTVLQIFKYMPLSVGNLMIKLGKV